MIGISPAFGRSLEDEQALPGKLMGSTHEGIHKQGWRGVIEFFFLGNERKSVSKKKESVNLTILTNRFRSV